jgi:hypothetical protein
MRRAELVDVRHRIDQLTHEVAGVPFQPEVLAVGGVEELFPQARLPEHVVVHDRQMIRALRAMLECNPDAVIGGEFRQRLPKGQQARQVLIEGW